MKRLFLFILSVVPVLLTLSGTASAACTLVAVAANFTEPAKEIAKAFEIKTGLAVVLSFGSTGQFYTQIKQDAPFAILMAADAVTPKMIDDEGLAMPGSRFTYSIGRLVLWGRGPAYPASEAVLRGGSFARLAVANPKLAPYGAAAAEVLRNLGIYDALASKLVQGNNIAQTLQFVDTGNAELGFVALSQLITREEGTYWIVPETLHAPIRQDAVLLRKRGGEPVARAFFL
ncbi:MAG: molybdate ABC transporter substrate-binding protein, partial [Rhodospirillaceae bacterium]